MKTMISSRGLCSDRPACNIRRFLTSSGWSSRLSTGNLPPAASADGRVAHCRQRRHVSLPSSLKWHKRSLRAEGVEEGEGAEVEGEGAEKGEGVEEGEGPEEEGEGAE